MAGWLGRCRFPRPGSPAAVAVSGGPDSMALLVLACAAGLDVTAYHVDHGLRPGGAGEAAHVAAAAAALGARFESRTVEVGAGPDLEARARAARYGALPAGVMTGHTADDVAETLLLNLMRGAGLDGLAPMTDPGARPVSRPLLALRRADTEAVCVAARVQALHDPSNEDLRFTRNGVRHRLIPCLAELSQRDPVPLLARQAELLADDAAYLRSLAATLDPTDASGLTAAPLPLARRAVRGWLRSSADAEAHPPSAAEVARVLAVAAGDAVACEVSGGRRVARHRGRLQLTVPATCDTPHPPSLTGGSRVGPGAEGVASAGDPLGR